MNGEHSCDFGECYSSNTEEQALAGELAGSQHLAHTKRVSVRVAARPCSESGLAGTLA
jgi:hypothetical protein